MRLYKKIFPFIVITIMISCVKKNETLLEPVKDLNALWKIESVTLILEFKDQHGNLHPTMGNKTIVFSNAYGFLNNDYRDIECITDGNLAPLTAVIKK